MLESHKHRLLDHLKCLGLFVNVQKSMLQPSQTIASLGKILDLRSMITCSFRNRCTILNALAAFKLGRAVALKSFLRLLGLSSLPLVSAANEAASGMAKSLCPLKSMERWTDMHCGGVCLSGCTICTIRQKVETTDASLNSWGALCDGRPEFSTWTNVRWHINCLELKDVCKRP